MTNHSSSNAAVALDPTDGYDHLVGVLGGRLIKRRELVHIDPFEMGAYPAETHEMTSRADAEEN